MGVHDHNFGVHDVISLFTPDKNQRSRSSESALCELIAEGYPVKREDVTALSPYLTRHIKRFGDYFIDLSTPPQPLSEIALSLSL
jgi:hypothetical protein